MKKEKDSQQSYIELVYSADSELNKIENLQERKLIACKKSGLDPENEFVKTMMEMTNSKSNILIINYLNKNNDNYYVKLMSDQQLFYNLQRMILDPEKIDIDQWLKISEKTEELVERIERYKKKIYKHDQVIEVANKVIRMKTPEQRLREAKEQSNSPASPNDHTLASAG